MVGHLPKPKLRLGQKRLYTSSTDKHGSPSMLATHMQAAVYTRFLPDWMAKYIFGGVGAEDNLSWRYIWSALDKIVRGEKTADSLVFCMGQWSDGTDLTFFASVERRGFTKSPRVASSFDESAYLVVFPPPSRGRSLQRRW